MNENVAGYCYGYIRITRQSIPAERQEEEIRNWARNNNCEVLAIEIDNEVGAEIRNRPGFVSILERIGENDILVTFSFNSLARNFDQCMTALRLIEEKRAYFACIREEYDTRTNLGQTVIRIMSSITQIQNNREDLDDWFERCDLPMSFQIKRRD